MNIVLKILGVLLLLGGIVVGGLVATSDEAKFADEMNRDNLQQLEKAEKDLQLAKGSYDEPEKLKKAEGWRKTTDLSAKALSDRKRNNLIGFIGSGVLIIFGLGLFGISFVVGKKKV